MKKKKITQLYKVLKEGKKDRTEKVKAGRQNRVESSRMGRKFGANVGINVPPASP